MHIGPVRAVSENTIASLLIAKNATRAMRSRCFILLLMNQGVPFDIYFKPADANEFQFEYKKKNTYVAVISFVQIIGLLVWRHTDSPCNFYPSVFQSGQVKISNNYISEPFNKVVLQNLSNCWFKKWIFIMKCKICLGSLNQLSVCNLT